MRWSIIIIVFLLGLVNHTIASPTKVDTELVILIDSSASITNPDYDRQKEIYRNALISDDVIEMIMSNYNQSVSITIIEFAGADGQPTTFTIVRDFIVSSQKDMNNLISIFPEYRSLSGSTYTIEAINTALDVIYSNNIESTQRIINVIIDGTPTDTSGIYTLRARLDQLRDDNLNINCMMVANEQDARHLRYVCDEYIKFGPKGKSYRLIDDQMQRMLIDNFSIEIY